MNHFVSIEVSETGEQWLLVHTGSRQLGKQIADHYTELAERKLNDHSVEIALLIAKLQESGRQSEIHTEIKKLKSTFLTRNKEFAYIEGADYKHYLNDMKIAQAYADWNRKAIAGSIFDALGIRNGTFQQISSVHNYIDPFDGILRKGAISARFGHRVIIPLNMRDGSVLAEGLSNEDANCSAPHGAGRAMSRRRAFEELDLKEYVDSMSGIYSSSVGESTLDEAPGAYKSADSIIEHLTPFVSHIQRLTPIYNFKASE
jgi:RNA-splicing ligase RtcB